MPVHTLLDNAATSNSKRPALNLVLRYMGPLKVGARLNYGQLLEQVNRLAAALLCPRRAQRRPRRTHFAQPAAVRDRLLRLPASWVRSSSTPTRSTRPASSNTSSPIPGAETVILLSYIYPKLKEFQPHTQIKRVIITDLYRLRGRCQLRPLVARTLHAKKG